MTRFFCISKQSFAFICILTIAMAAGLPVSAAGTDNASQTTFVEIMGSGKIIDDDDAAAKEAAISNSLVSAVGLVISKTLSLDLLIRNFKTINELFYDHTNQFILGYKVLTETKHKNLYRVIVRARVSNSKIKHQLNKAGFILTKKDMPKVLFLISQKNINDMSPQYWWGDNMPNVSNIAESAISKMLQKKGLHIVSHESIIQLPENESIIMSQDLDNKTAIAIGSLFHADIIIVGKATANQASNTMGADLRSYKGIVSARAIKIANGHEIASTIQTNLTVNTDETTGGTEAISGAGYLAGDDLALKIANAWQSGEKQSRKIEITIEGTGYLSNFVKFRRTVNDLPGVIGLQNKAMKSDEAVIVVDFQGTPRDLAKLLMVKSFDAFGVNIAEVTEVSMRISLIPRNRLHY